MRRGAARLRPLPMLAGAAAGILQMAGALKTATPAAGLPVDLTLLGIALLLPAAALLAATRQWTASPALAVPIAAAALLWLWLVLAASWSASSQVVLEKLPEVVLLAPVMLVAGLVAGAEADARRALAGTTIAIGLVLAGSIGWQIASGQGLVTVEAGDQARLQYQLAGLAMAAAAALAAVRLVEARHVLARCAWAMAILALAFAALIPGGRTALVALLLGVALAPALRLRLPGGSAWALAVLLAGLGALSWLALNPAQVEGLRTLERLTGDTAGLEARRGLWAAALAWAGETAPLGLGTGGFTIAAGHGERRGLYPHNHALEALAEGGLPGLLLWLGAFGGAALVLLRAGAAAGPARQARIAAMVLPVALTVMVSTDLGNRMAWFALGLALSLGLTARPLAADRPPHACHV